MDETRLEVAVKPLTLAVWSVWGTVQTRTFAAWRIARVKRLSDNREGWAAVLPDVWGRWNG